MRHALGVLGVLAAAVLLVVSAAMNWSFGFSLGRTEFDSHLYGAASAAADGLKALLPFFLFAAIRNKIWSQAAAAAVVWVVVIGFSFTSAVGQSALNRKDSAGKRTEQSLAYKDTRAALKQAQSELGWVPQHRPMAALQSAIQAYKNQSPWRWTKACTKVTGPKGRGYCDKYHALKSELGSAERAAKLKLEIATLSAKLSTATGAELAGGDPQAEMLAGLMGLDVNSVQTGMALLLAVLLEIGSGLGMYVAFSQWRLYDMAAPAVPAAATEPSVVVAAVKTPKAKAKPRVSANDNKRAPKLVAPETDVERFRKESVATAEGSSLTATELYEDYCSWCEDQQKEPLALPTFGREFGELNGIKKAKIAGRVRYIGIKLKSQSSAKEDKKPPVPIKKAA